MRGERAILPDDGTVDIFGQISSIPQRNRYKILVGLDQGTGSGADVCRSAAVSVVGIHELNQELAFCQYLKIDLQLRGIVLSAF